MAQEAPTHIFTKRLNWKGFLVALIVVLGFEIFAFHLLSNGDPKVAKPTEISTANWGTYTNNIMGFTVKLPTGWYTHPETNDGDKTQTFLSYPVDGTIPNIWEPKQEAGITVISYPSDGHDIRKTAQQWIDDTNKTNPGTFEKQIKTQTVAGKVAVVLTSKATHMEYIYLTNGNTTYMITLATAVADKHTSPPIPDIPLDNYQTMFDQILATFMFTK